LLQVWPSASNPHPSTIASTEVLVFGEAAQRKPFTASTPHIQPGSNLSQVGTFCIDRHINNSVQDKPVFPQPTLGAYKTTKTNIEVERVDVQPPRMNSTQHDDAFKVFADPFHIFVFSPSCSRKSHTVVLSDPRPRQA